MHLLEDRAHRLDQRFGQGSQGHAAAAGDEQLVVEGMAQTRQHAAHRRLTEVDAAAGVGDVFSASSASSATSRFRLNP